MDIHGMCDARFAKVREVFEESFTKGEVGAGVSVVIDGEPVVDLWGGHADAERTRPWVRDTIVNVYSTTKGMTALCALRLVDRGELDVDTPVAKYWPEFAQDGKQDIPVRWLLCHKAGLATVMPASGRMLDWDEVCTALAEAKPTWEPGTAHGYHAMTFGNLVGEVVRRIDGRSLGTFFREEIAEPLGADFLIGFGPEHDARCADVIAAPALEGTEQPAGAIARRAGGGGVNSRAWRAAELPAGNGHGTAAAVARVYGDLARANEDLLSKDTLARALEEQCFGEDRVLAPLRTRFGLGFMLTHPGIPFGPNPRSFGHPGAGGSVGFADPDERLGFGYVMNQMQAALVGSAHGFNLANAVYQSL